MSPELREQERRNDLRPHLEERIEEDYHAMKAWLPESVTDILDIGCGYPLIDVWLARHYGGAVTVHLMDGEENRPPVGKENVGFRSETIPWKSRHDAVRALQWEMPECKVYGYPPDPSLTIPSDLIVSRRAWGHHFPIKTYVDLAKRSVRENGRIIVDIRIGTNGLSVFQSRGFRVISDNLERRSVKCQRFALSRDKATGRPGHGRCQNAR